MYGPSTTTSDIGDSASMTLPSMEQSQSQTDVGDFTEDPVQEYTHYTEDASQEQQDTSGIINFFLWVSEQSRS